MISKDMLKKTIRDIVRDHSGGIKFIDLVGEVMSLYREQSVIINTDLSDMIEKTVKDMSDLRILEYIYEPLKRIKMFVYTPNL